ncbi:hypothetical protein [Alcaligenes faecalis]|uniref:hypothetical protein n=1 Tax=Alcaligenes faecalis TaxID=511 RepID=UPI001C83729F|nr:hypothetical protein [Alcaligenes faecalis]MBX6965808.1 hypothetical protein [Providencia rettgeri]MBX7031388.1 hypothetical protein [Alcaligenes faecalis]
MTTIDASTRQKIVEISAMVDNNLVSIASEELSRLMTGTPKSSLALLQPDLTMLISRFQKKRRRVLLEDLQGRLASGNQQSTTKSPSELSIEAAPLGGKQITTLEKRYSVRFDELRDRHIFQWATYYRDTILFIFGDARDTLTESADWHQEIEKFGYIITNHASDIFGRGFKYQIENGLSADIAEIKSISGLQKFLYLIISIFMEQRESVSHAKDAEITWSLASTLLTGVLNGFGKANYGADRGWEFLARNLKAWLPALGFARGSEALNLIEEFPEEYRNNDVYITIVPALLGVERLAHRFHGDEVFLPRLSRLWIGHAERLDLTLTIRNQESSRELLISSYYSGIIKQAYHLSEALALRANVVVGQLDPALAEHDSSSRVLNASEMSPTSEQAHNFAEMIDSELHLQVVADAASHSPGVLNRNYAREFPLEDPDFRKQFFVQRYSVKRLLENIEGGTGVHLWCSIRRSGKTTAATSLADLSGQLVVVVQTMDHQPHQIEQNIFARKIQEALSSQNAISPHFFKSVVDECILATTAMEVKDRKVLFIVDEYETLFGLIDAYVYRDPGLRFTVALPLLSQMVAFAAKNLLIFMGQRPDAHLILSAQNQLSPLVRQYNFPLFEHHVGAADTEFTQFLHRVLQEPLPFDSSFSDAVYEETNGHPYLTVNLMVDFCDWLISTGFMPGNGPLGSGQFANFTKDRLTLAALQRSPHYVFFHGMLAEYSSELGRNREPWLSAITNVLQEMARKHPKIFTCSVNSFNLIAAPYGQGIRMTPQRFLASASMSNFLRDRGGQVMPGVRLMARLAASVTPRIN